MTMTLVEGTDQRTSAPSAQRLRMEMTAARVSLRWFGVRKALTPQQKTQAAESFGAEEQFLSARKKLLDTRDPAYKQVTAVRGRVLSYWKGMSLPYPEAGLRLIRQDKLDEFNQHMTELRAALHDAVNSLDRHYDELKSNARRRLGELYNPGDYPPSLEGLFDVEWDFPNIEPPDYLLQLNPSI